MNLSVPSPWLKVGVAAALALLSALIFVSTERGGAHASGAGASPPAAPRTPAPTPRPFDLVEQNFDSGAPRYDANQLLLNPQWGWQQNNPRDPADPLKHYPDSSDTDL